MKETQAQIKKYQALLPYMREKLAMVAMLLIMSTVMLTSATFAWIVLSKNPEVKGINTTVAANGNLEIALSSNDGMEPDISKVGDSTAAGNPVKDANLTWGNLINLSDGYGLDNLTLRPATLNINGLQSGSPLWGATYGRDGRIEKLKSDFAYTVWQEASEGQAAAFVVPTGDAYGVRAISSVVYTNLSGDTTFRELVDTAEEKNAEAGNAYLAITNTKEYMESITGLMGEYLTYRLNGGAAPDCSAYVESLYLMMLDFYGAMEIAGESLAYLANTQQFLKVGSDYIPYTAETIVSASTQELQNNGVNLQSLPQYKSDLAGLKKDISSMEKYYKAVRDNGAVITWTQLNSIVNRVVDINSCTVDGKAVQDIGASDAGSFMGGGSHEAVIHKGYLYNMEKLTGCNMYVKDLSVKVKYKISVTLNANVYTALKDTGVSNFYIDLNLIKDANKGSYVGGDAVAQDTYGMALDVWVRTNAAGSYLTLNGSVVTRERQENVVGTIINENNEQESVDLYTYKATAEDNEGNTVEYDMDVYQKNGQWYNYADNSLVEVTATPKQKVNIIQEVIDYEGENRIWENNGLLTEDNTTQGSGSCYVYYADTPEDSSRSLELLKSMKVAFISSNNTLLSTATMDTDNVYAVNGKYTVPLIIEQSNYTIQDEYGTEIKSIMPLIEGQATRITAILYLDGGTLTNNQVLTAADIRGTLNLQFGSSVPLETIGDSLLEDAVVSVSASANKTSFNYDTEQDLSTVITVNVDGFEPNIVEARFQRAINGTQGTRMGKITFSSTGTEGEWTGNYVFNAPGNYILRAISLDGVEYELHTPINITVTGFTLTSLTCDKTEIMTAERTETANLTLTFATNDEAKMPRTVQGRFMKQDGTSTTVNFERNTTTNVWSGNATFVSSGVYTLQFLVLDGQYVEIPENYQKQIEASLGMKTRVYISRTGEDTSLTFKFYGGSETFNVSAIVMDDTGEEIEALTGVKLFYEKKGSVLVENGMNSDLTWNRQTGRYEGQFLLTNAGIYNFRNLRVGGHTITVATNAPTVTAQSPEPPQYVGVVDLRDYQFAPENNANMTIQVAYSSSASSIKAVFIKDGNKAKTYTVDATVGTESMVDGKPTNKWSITIPMDGTTQDGTWTLTELHVAGVYDAAGKEYTEEKPMVLKVTDAPTTKVVCAVVVNFDENLSQQFGGTADNVTGHFMDSYDVTGLNVYITDKNGNALPSVTDVALTYNRKAGTEDEYGYYTAEHLNGTSDGESITIPLNAVAGESTHFAQKDKATLQYAGKYEATFSFKVNGKEYIYGGDSGKALPANTPEFTIRSMKPTIKVTGTDPAPKETYSVKSSGDSEILNPTYLEGVRNYYTDYYANVYFYSNWGEQAPSVTLTISNAGDAFTKASVLVPNGDNANHNRTYTFTDDNTSKTQKIGGISSVVNRDVAGNQNISTISMEYGGKAYTVELSNTVTIRQVGYAPPYLKFANVDENYNATPSTIISQDGKSMTITLPTMETWTLRQNFATPLGEPIIENTTSTVSQRYTKNLIQVRYRYYTRTVTKTTTESLKETYDVEYGIIGWKIGSKTYAPGDKVTISSGQTATAVVGEVRRDFIEKQNSIYITEHTLDVLVSEDNRKSSGTVVSDIYTTKTLTKEEYK